ncbi:MAG: enhanced serine sensitivity protein SseB C-terminal domain-containing protein [Elusimicrobia bacterium]|nr:enhanced serine sensitivity protein SseB C-terminal domain-containing protein [Elusimicrobiota bacterium]
MHARYGPHASLPGPLLARLTALAAAQEALKGVYLFTMTVEGSDPASAFGFVADGSEVMKAANAFLEAADPDMPASLISQDIQALPLTPDAAADIRPFAVIVLER